MIALVFSPFWVTYYASSPYLNLLNTKHPRFEHILISPHELVDPVVRERINACRAVVTDDVLVYHLSFYTSGPKIMVGGDIHAFTDIAVVDREKQFDSCDYVLSGGIFAPKLPRYKYIRPHYEDRLIYMPNCVPSTPPPKTAWELKEDTALLSGNDHPDVYPFRYGCRGIMGVESLPQNQIRHGEYFSKLASYKMGITCNSLLEYTVAKYYEIPWVGSLLVAKDLPEPERSLIGLRSGDNCVLLEGPDKVRNTVELVLNNREYFKGVADKGSELMSRCHTAYSRLNYIARLVDKIGFGGFVPQDGLTEFIEEMRNEGVTGIT